MYAFYVLFVALLSCSSLVAKELHIVVVIASYNNKDWFKKNLESVLKQKYSNYDVVYVDDGSSDGTADLVQEYIQKYDHDHKITLIRNKVRLGGPLGNHYKVIQECDNRDIIAILDGDDWFAHDRVLAYVDEVYKNPSIWLTYGQFTEYPAYSPGFCCDMPVNVVRNNLFRTFTHIPSHLRTFYAGLFKRIKKEDLCDDDGSFLNMAGDMAAMIPMIEMACDHFKFISEILYVYNGANVLNEHKISKGRQRAIDLRIRALPRYEKLETLF